MQENENDSISDLIQAVDENTIETNSILEGFLQMQARIGDVSESQLEVADRTYQEIKNLSEKMDISEDGKGDTFVIRCKKGDSPTKEELLELIVPLIPEPVKGEDGKTPTEDELIDLIIPLIPEPIKGEDGIDGQDYILTEQDKKEIAKSIEVPVGGKIIEKTEVIKEVAKKDTPKQIKEKLLSEGLSYDELDNTPDIAKMVRVYSKQSSKTTSLSELDDVNLAGLTQTNGKYNLGSGGGDGGVDDGDKGDITVSDNGATWTIDNDVVTFAKMQNVASQSILGRYSALSGDIEELTLGDSITLSGAGVIDTIQPLGTDAEVTFSTLTIDSLSNSLPGIAFFDATGKIDTWDEMTYPSLDELSYVKGVTSAIQTQLNAITSDLSALANGMVYKGDWDASAGTFPGGGVAQTGWFYYVSVDGTVDSVEFTAGDNIVATTDNASTTTYASNWSKHDQTDAVTAVVGIVGSISKANLLTALNVEDGADVTDTANVTSAGALMDSEVSSLATIKTLTFGTGVATAIGVNIGSAGAMVLLNGALGTPSSGTLTNATGLPISGLVPSTSTALGVGSLELGHASDTTIARVSAGVISVEGVTVPTISSTNTLTNKRITERVGSTTSSATPTINTDNVDAYSITALATAITSMTTNISGTPTNFQKLIIRIKDDGTARAITWGASFEDAGQALPTTTVISKLLTVGFIYNTVTSKWGCVAVANET